MPGIVGSSPIDKVYQSCVYIFPNGDKYDGEYTHDAEGRIYRQGYGVNTSAGGVVCKGQWEGDRIVGKGIILHPSGAVYEGEIYNNAMHGVGKYTFVDQSIYEGQFNENKMEGNGKFTDSTGQIWCGEFNFKTANGLVFKLSM